MLQMPLKTIPTLCLIALLYGCDSAEGTTAFAEQRMPLQANFEEANLTEAEPLVAYRGATLIDGTGRNAIDNAVILVQGQRILAAGSKLEVPPNATQVDVSGKWIVPGLIDAHVHFMTSGRSYTRPGMMDLQHIVPYEDEIDWIETHVPDTLRSMLCAGVTGAVSMGGPKIEYQARQKARRMAGAPTVFIGHGVAVPVPRFLAERLFPRWRGEMTLKPVTSAEDGTAFVRQAAANQAQLIKTAVDDRGSFLFGLILKLVGWQSIHKVMIEEAAANGLTITSHVHQLEPARTLTKLGVGSLQHLPSDAPLDQDFLRLAKQKELIVVPTLALHERTFEQLYSKEFDLLSIEKACGIPEVIESWYENLPPRDDDVDYLTARREQALANTRSLYEAGVSLAVGTDAGLMGLLHGPSMHLELRKMHQAGMSTEALIVAATLNSAKSAGIAQDYGSVEPGKFADFLILSKDPLQDIANLQALETIVKHGKAFQQQQLFPQSASGD